jgi:hypothetical protein
LQINLRIPIANKIKKIRIDTMASQIFVSQDNTYLSKITTCTNGDTKIVRRVYVHDSLLKIKLTISAAVRVIPKPPARVERRNANFDEPFELNSSI